MFLLSGFSESWSIYMDHLSFYYVICVFLSLLAVVVACFYQNTCSNTIENLTEESVDSLIPTESNLGDDVSRLSDERKGSMSSEREFLIDSVTSKMSTEELMAELESEKKQLEGILELVAKNKEKFGIDSMDDLQQQMRLYRDK